MEQDEDRTLARLKAFRQSCVEPLITRYRGRTVKLMGDGALVEFASVVDAVRCAVAIQQVCGGKEAKIPSSRRIRLRIGINLGDVIREADGDLYGDGVNVAARLEHLAEPGGVIISGTAYDHLQGKLDLPLEFIGERRVRSIERPVRIYRVRFGGTAARLRFKLRRPGRPAAALLLLLSLGAGAWWHGLQGPGQDTALPDRPAIAVLPFDDFSGGERQERLAGAFTEDLITELARTRSLLVIARNSVEAIKGNGTDVREVGRLLGVHYVLEGSLQVEPARIRINAQLIDAASGTHLWSERYDRPAGDLFRVRDEVLTRLVGTLTGYDGAIWTEWRERAQRRTPGSLTAWDYYLLAADPYRRHDRDGMLEAQRLVERAIVLDPGFARAWAFLAGIHEQDALNGWSGDRDRAWQKSDEAAQRAADLDPADAEVQLTLGNAHFRKGEVELGWQAWQRALELAPNNALVNRWVGGSIAQALGAERAHEGIRLVERSLNELDPLHPPFHYLTYAMPLYFAGRYADVVTALEKVPDPWLEVRVMLALSCAQAGFADQARQHAREVLRLDPGFNAEAWVDNDLYQPGGSSAALFIAGARKAACRSARSPGRPRASTRATACPDAMPSGLASPPRGAEGPRGYRCTCAPGAGLAVPARAGRTARTTPSCLVSR